MNILEVVDAGVLTTVQDLGRVGYQRYGVPVSGAADPFALRTANLLAGNSPGDAALEITLVGPRLRLLGTTVVALAGADLSPRLDDATVPTWEPFVAPAGATLSFGDARDGVRGYLAIHGGIDVPRVLGSRSTNVRLKLGGVEGRPLQAGDRLAAQGDRSPSSVAARRLAREDVPVYGHAHALRVVLGPQDSAFTDQGIRRFLSSPFVVTGQSDRTGCRLQGPVIEHATSPDIVSDGIPFGAVQVAGDGMPMVLLADRGTTGGYTKIATVVSVDLPRLAQAAPGDTVTFQRVTVEEAHALYRSREAMFERLAASPPVIFARQQLVVTVGGAAVTVETDLEEAVPAPTGAGRGVQLPPTTLRVSGRSGCFVIDVGIERTGD